MSDRAGTLLFMDELTDQDRRILKVAATVDIAAGTRGLALPDDLGLSPTRFFQRLDALLDDPAALTAEPVLVNRLRRVRAGMRRSRWDRRRAVSAS